MTNERKPTQDRQPPGWNDGYVPQVKTEMMAGRSNEEEGDIWVPYLLHREEHLPPPLVALSILAFGSVFGVLGVILAVPLGMAGYVLARETIYED